MQAEHIGVPPGSARRPCTVRAGDATGSARRTTPGAAALLGSRLQTQRKLYSSSRAAANGGQRRSAGTQARSKAPNRGLHKGATQANRSSRANKDTRRNHGASGRGARPGHGTNERSIGSGRRLGRPGQRGAAYRRETSKRSRKNSQKHWAGAIVAAVVDDVLTGGHGAWDIRNEDDETDDDEEHIDVQANQSLEDRTK